MSEAEQKKVESVFDLALKARKEQAEEVEQKKNYVPTDFEEIEYCAVDYKEKVIRPVGDPFNPQTLTSAKDTDIKIFMHSQIEKDDKSGYVHINWPAKVKTTRAGIKIIPDPDFILTKLYNKVMERNWVEYPEGKKEIRNGKEYTGEWHYPNKETEIFKRIDLNGKNGQMNKFEPSAYVLMNVIDRTDSWCEDNKHTKLFISKMGKGKEQTNEAGVKFTPQYPTKGISPKYYDDIFERSVKVSGGWNKDLVVKKTGEKLDTKYWVYDASDLRVQTEDITKESFALAKETGMPSDWEMYNTKRLTDPSSAFKMKKHLEGLFKMFDATFNRHLTEELSAIAKIEQEEYNKAHPKEDSSAQNTVDAQKKEQTKSIVEESKATDASAVKRERVATGSTKSIAELCVENFPAWDKVSAEDKAIMVDSVEKFDGTTPIYKAVVNGKPIDLGPCAPDPCFYKGTSIQTNFPIDMKVCPVCGAVYG